MGVLNEADVRRIVADMLGIDISKYGISVCRAHGAASKKMLGELVASAGMYSRYVVVDLGDVTRIANRKPAWRA